MRMSEALRRGISRNQLYALLKRGDIERLRRGVYRLADFPVPSNPDHAIIASRFPKAVICLISALAFHEMTTQVPHAVAIALPIRSRIPSPDYPPLEVYRFATQAYRAGIDEHRIDGVTVKVYDPEKTLADCFKFRNKIGMDVVLEALKLYRDRRKMKLQEILRYAKICRVANAMRPYLEAIT